ncbi:hypothetical protein [Leptospira levettii]|uniref:DUF86 domain-containing protein n=1 Tax=Leptospira levettii TaxID=2023178 RepID=A0ABY2MJH3_9LEPT|nr:hypothetical protein [Leptospira levettii]PKA22571.1 hypothetical protein CH381_30185 [Leptospira sp. mixed culture ATI2-C-A1]TGL66518.1 hypothetical protein EHQ60_18715 [Leptospira levettii]
MNKNIFNEEELNSIIDSFNLELDKLLKHEYGKSEEIEFLATHLYIEQITYYAIGAIDNKLEKLNTLKLSFSKIIQLLELISEDIPFIKRYIPLIKELNNIRNEIAHKIGYSKEKTSNFIEKLSKFRYSSFKNPKNLIKKQTDYLKLFKIDYAYNVVVFTVTSEKLHKKIEDMDKILKNPFKDVEIL